MDHDLKIELGLFNFGLVHYPWGEEWGGGGVGSVYTSNICYKLRGYTILYHFKLDTSPTTSKNLGSDNYFRFLWFEFK